MFEIKKAIRNKQKWNSRIVLYQSHIVRRSVAS